MAEFTILCDHLKNRDHFKNRDHHKHRGHLASVRL